jgi:hypothetical protein
MPPCQEPLPITPTNKHYSQNHQKIHQNFGCWHIKSAVAAFKKLGICKS